MKKIFPRMKGGIKCLKVSDKIPINNENDLLFIYGYTKKLFKELPFSELDEQKVLVSVSELTRNVIDHANRNGFFSCKIDDEMIRIIIEDFGPGIKNLDDILKGNETSFKGLGIGLTAVYRLMDEVNIDTSERGTKIIVTKRGEKR